MDAGNQTMLAGGEDGMIDPAMDIDDVVEDVVAPPTKQQRQIKIALLITLIVIVAYVIIDYTVSPGQTADKSAVAVLIRSGAVKAYRISAPSCRPQFRQGQLSEFALFYCMYTLGAIAVESRTFPT